MLKNILKKTRKPRVTRRVVATAEASTEVVVNVEASKIIASITHPNKKILAEKILNGVSSEELIKEYGNTRFAEMQNYIQNYSVNLAKNAELNAKRGCNGVCVACQK